MCFTFVAGSVDSTSAIGIIVGSTLSVLFVVVCLSLTIVNVLVFAYLKSQRTNVSYSFWPCILIALICH